MACSAWPRFGGQLTQLSQTTHVRRVYSEALGQFLRVVRISPPGQARHWRRAVPLFSAVTEKRASEPESDRLSPPSRQAPEVPHEVDCPGSHPENAQARLQKTLSSCLVNLPPLQGPRRTRRRLSLRGSPPRSSPVHQRHSLDGRRTTSERHHEDDEVPGYPARSVSVPKRVPQPVKRDIVQTAENEKKAPFPGPLSVSSARIDLVTPDKWNQ